MPRPAYAILLSFCCLGLAALALLSPFWATLALAGSPLGFWLATRAELRAAMKRQAEQFSVREQDLLQGLKDAEAKARFAESFVVRALERVQEVELEAEAAAGHLISLRGVAQAAVDAPSKGNREALYGVMNSPVEGFSSEPHTAGALRALRAAVWRHLYEGTTDSRAALREAWLVPQLPPHPDTVWRREVLGRAKNLELAARVGWEAGQQDLWVKLGLPARQVYAENAQGVLTYALSPWRRPPALETAPNGGAQLTVSALYGWTLTLFTRPTGVHLQGTYHMALAEYGEQTEWDFGKLAWQEARALHGFLEEALARARMWHEPAALAARQKWADTVRRAREALGSEGVPRGLVEGIHEVEQALSLSGRVLVLALCQELTSKASVEEAAQAVKKAAELFPLLAGALGRWQKSFEELVEGERHLLVVLREVQQKNQLLRSALAARQQQVQSSGVQGLAALPAGAVSEEEILLLLQEDGLFDFGGEER